MTKIIISPGKYIQGSGELKRIKDHVGHLGKSFFIIISESGHKRFGETVKESFGDSVNIHFAKFNGECSKGEIKRLEEEVKSIGADVIIGIGGGKNP